jgi:AcrR family transcriptional regulator
MRAAEPSEGPKARGRKPRLSSGDILEQAVGLLDREGLQRFTLRALAEELEVSAMALYRYYADKDDLLDAIVAHTLAPIAERSRPGASWQVRLSDTLREMHKVLIGAPSVAQLMATRLPGSQIDPLRELFFEIAAEAGFSQREADNAVRAVTSYVLGSALVRPARDMKLQHRPSVESFDYGLSILLDGLQNNANRAGGNANVD